MNNTFNLNRFGLLVKRQWLEFGKIYLMSLVVITGVLVGFYIYGLPEHSPKSTSNFQWNNEGFILLKFRIPLFLIVGFVFISIIASNYFALLGQKSKAIIELMTPASKLEKWLCGIFYTGILSVFSYLLIFYLTDLVFADYLEKAIGHITYAVDPKIQTNQETIVVSVQPFFDEFFKHEEFRAMIFVPFLITSAFLLGSVYFNRFHYIKTAVTAMVFIGALMYTMFKVGEWLTKNKIYDSSNAGFKADNVNIFSFVLIATAIITLFFWTIAFFRVEEKEV